MIFGIELAFALVPLVITATEHHQRAYRKAKLVASSKARDEKLQDFLTELHDEVALLGNTLRSLISDLTTLTERQREQLLNYDQEEWNREEVNAALRARLGGESDLAFIDILDRLLKSLEDVVSEKSLNFVSSENVRTSSSSLFKKLEGFREEMQNGKTVQDLKTRFQFTHREDRRNKNLKKIIKCNKKLERFVNGKSSNITDDSKKSARVRKTRPPTNRSRRLSQDAHSRIVRSWSCSCSSPHEAKLSLLKCLMSQENADSAINLDLLVSMVSVEHAKEIWLESKIRILPTKEEATVDSVVKFADDKDSINSPKSTNSRHTFESAATLRDPRRFIETESVCTLIKEAHKNKSTLELVFDGKELWQAKSTGSRVVVRPEIGIPLNQLLGDSHYRLKLKESRALAVVLGHAILHYCENSWASNNWNKQHVNFFANANGPDLMRPYLATQFDTPAPHLRDSTDSVYSHPSPALLSLGILLLELYLSKPIESLWELADTDDGVEGPLTNWITAEKWLDKLGDDLYEGYRKAIEACLKIDYVDDEESFSLDDERFRKLVYERVVVPLEDELENGFHITPDQLGVW